ncbi:NAD-dependent epimerase/dehydratase family protein [Streptomyces tsukubensis]|uniref:NAD-dependent epimerase/dehydratase family protein n=1 Tax=Streptomyces tsukubensis TaxID=83656 RepID=UPI0015C3FB3D|nr:NAD(P)-dependent oxidoreductase [Streptomyces tsukubensis]
MKDEERPGGPRAVLVTGSAGRIGSAVVDVLADAGFTVIGADRVERQGRRAVAHFAGDLADPAAVAACFDLAEAAAAEAFPADGRGGGDGGGDGDKRSDRGNRGNRGDRGGGGALGDRGDRGGRAALGDRGDRGGRAALGDRGDRGRLAAVVHLAAHPNPGIVSDHETLRANGMSAYAVLQEAGRRGVPRVVGASSTSAVGLSWADRELSPAYVPVDEEHPDLTVDSYGLSKVMAEQMAAFTTRRYGTATVMLRFPFVGAGERLRGPCNMGARAAGAGTAPRGVAEKP